MNTVVLPGAAGDELRNPASQNRNASRNPKRTNSALAR